MIKQAILNPLRRLAWRMLGPPPQGQSYVGQHGCVRCAASFLAWNQIDGDYLEFGTWEGGSFIEAYRSIWRARSDVKSFIRTEEIESWYQKRPRFIAFDSFIGLPSGSLNVMPTMKKVHTVAQRTSFSKTSRMAVWIYTTLLPCRAFTIRR